MGIPLNDSRLIPLLKATFPTPLKPQTSDSFQHVQLLLNLIQMLRNNKLVLKAQWKHFSKIQRRWS